MLEKNYLHSSAAAKIFKSLWRSTLMATSPQSKDHPILIPYTEGMVTTPRIQQGSRAGTVRSTGTVKTPARVSRKARNRITIFIARKLNHFSAPLYRTTPGENLEWFSPR